MKMSSLLFRFDTKNCIFINISQTEYVNKFHEYLERVRKRRNGNVQLYEKCQTNLIIDRQLISFLSNNVTLNNSNEYWHNKRKKRENRKQKPKKVHKNKNSDKSRKTTTLLQFSLNTLNHESKLLSAEEIEEANLRLLITLNSLSYRTEKLCNSTIINNSNYTKIYSLRMKVFYLDKKKRIFVDAKKIDYMHDEAKSKNVHSQWIQFDVTSAVKNLLRENQINLTIQIQCDNCSKTGALVLSDMSSKDEHRIVPVINIIMRRREMSTMKINSSSLTPENVFSEMTEDDSATFPGSCQQNKSKKPRCCRHSMQIVFSGIKGFEFIIQPKAFDAGYCAGRCPIRFNPAHHHSLLQGLVWKQSNGLRAPRPCCAPSKLVELEVLHVDEKNSEKLKISTWTAMRVIECACS